LSIISNVLIASLEVVFIGFSRINSKIPGIEKGSIPPSSVQLKCHCEQNEQLFLLFAQRFMSLEKQSRFLNTLAFISF